MRQDGPPDGLNQEGSVRLSGAWLLVARIGWLAVVGLSVAVFAVGLSGYLGNFRTLCEPGKCLYSGQLTQAALGQMSALGISLDAYVAYRTFLTLLNEAVWVGTALFLFIRRSDDPMALFVALMLAVQPAANPGHVLAEGGAWSTAGGFINALSYATIMTVWYVFPNGWFVPRWSRWLALLFILTLGTGIVASGTVFDTGTWPSVLATFWYLPFFAGVIAAPLYRYIKVATPTERQQMKWPLLAIGAIVVAQLIVDGMIPAMIPSTRDAMSLIEASPVYDVLFMLIPVSLAFAMLRYRLYDVDVLIRRTLVYSVLTVLLGLVYFGIVLLMQRVFAGATGEQSPLALVASTLAIAALFSPLRSRVQGFVDRRFYRRKYDAQEVLARFGVVAREETDLDGLSSGLERALQETVQPSHMGLWLQAGERR